jgi:hypothetical protein
MEKDKPEDLDALWEQISSNPAAQSTATTNIATSTNESVKIRRSYEFAGQLVTYAPCASVLTEQ